MGTPQPKTAIVLSGGASLGSVQVGMMRALFERRIAPDLIVGSSVGALNGAFIASRPPTPETADELAGIWSGLGRWQVFPLNPLTGFLGFFGARDHLVSDGPLRRLVSEWIGFEGTRRRR
jgi:NTE family protein